MVDQMYVEKLIPTGDFPNPPKFPIVFITGAAQTGTVSSKASAFFITCN